MTICNKRKRLSTQFYRLRAYKWQQLIGDATSITHARTDNNLKEGVWSATCWRCGFMLNWLYACVYTSLFILLWNKCGCVWYTTKIEQKYLPFDSYIKNCRNFICAQCKYYAISFSSFKNKKSCEMTLCFEGRTDSRNTKTQFHV